MKEARKTILLVEQNANLGLKLADRTYVLELGQVVLEGKSADIMNNPIVKELTSGLRNHNNTRRCRFIKT